MSTNPTTLEQLKQAIDERQQAVTALKEELLCRAQVIKERKRRCKTWEETKREILGRLP